MTLDLRDFVSAQRMKAFIKASRNFELLNRDRYEVQYKSFAIAHFTTYFGIEADKIVDVDLGYEGHRK